MASTFRLTSGSYEGRYLQLDCTQSKNIATNKSTISWTLSSVGGSSNYYSIGPTTVTINGKQVYYLGRVNWDAKTFPAAKGSISGTIVVDHDSKGNKEISVNLSTAVYSGTVKSYSGNWTLDNIPRQATITSSPNFTDLDNPTVYYSNPAGNAVEELMACISLTGANDDIKYRDISKTGTYYTFPLTEEERTLLRNNTKGGSRNVIFFVRTKIGGNQYHSTDTKTFTVQETDNTRPAVSMTVTLDNGSLPSQFNGIHIQGKSRLDVSISAQGKYSASITGYSAKIGDEIYNSQAFTSNVIQKDGTVEIIGYAKDSRQFTGSTRQEITVAAYSKPLVIPIGSETAIHCYRSDGNGKRIGNSTSVWVKAKRSYHSVSGKNQCALQWRRKLVTEPWNDSTHQWKNLIPKTNTTTSEYNALISGEVFDLKKSYTIQIRAVDDIGEQDFKTFEIPTQDVALHLGKGGKNVSVGTYCDYSKEHTFYSDWDAYFDKDVYVNENLSVSGDVYVDGYKIGDFVVESGEKNGWIYTKWNSGIVECSNCNYTAIGNDLSLADCEFTFPFNIYNATMNVTFGAESNVWASLKFVKVDDEKGGQAHGQCNPGETTWFYVFVRGKWK